MRFSQIIATTALGAASTALSQATQDAPVITNNPVGTSAKATLPAEPFFKEGSLRGNVQGSIQATSGPNGVGVDFVVHFSNLPQEGGPFTYHIHDAPVPADGNCTSTLAHLDPYQRGEDPACDPADPANCQVGDLAGKHGKINATFPSPFVASYNDPYSSLIEGQGSYFGNRSFVFHFENKTRISCANFNVHQHY